MSRSKGPWKYHDLKPADPELVRQNDGLCFWALRKWFGLGTAMNAHLHEDLLQEARIGLILAAQRFDPSRGANFGVYALAWIRQTVDRALRMSPVVRKSLTSLRSMPMSEALSVRCVELTHEIEHEPDEPGPEISDADAALMLEAREALIHARLTRLPMRDRSRAKAERDVALFFRHRFDGETLQALGDEVGLSRERVRQLCLDVGVLFENFSKSVREEAA